jgi:DNA polymerase (family 10)
MTDKSNNPATAAGEPCYVDNKGRKRWHRNDEVAGVVKQLGDYLIIGGYPPDHAKRYARLAHTISRMPELVDALAENNQLESIAGVGGTITGYLDEIVRTGTTAKFNDNQYGELPPRSVLELTSVHKLGAGTARVLYREHGIDSMQSLCQALADGRLAGIRGIGPAMLKTIGAHCE